MRVTVTGWLHGVLTTLYDAECTEDEALDWLVHAAERFSQARTVVVRVELLNGGDDA